MSYFGTSGPAQDGGFVAGIGAGATRLNNARAARSRQAKRGIALGAVYQGQEYNDKRLTIDQFFASWSNYLKPIAITKYKANRITEPFWVSYNEVNPAKAEQEKLKAKKKFLATIKQKNPLYTDVEVNIRAEQEARRETQIPYQRLFEHAGYTEEEARNFAIDIVAYKSPGPALLERTADTLNEYGYEYIWAKGDEEAGVEYVVRRGLPQNTVQWILVGGGTILAIRYLRGRSAQKNITARKGAFYGVFS